MIATLLSFEHIEVVYTQEVDHNRHLILEQQTPGVFTVLKDGLALRRLFEVMLQLKSQTIEEQNNQNNLISPIFVCLSSKSKKVVQPILRAIHAKLEEHFLYFSIDKNQFKEVMFNRPYLIGNDICFGEGLSQLRPKEELRIALSSLLKSYSNIQYIFIEKNVQELKELKKEGFANIVDQFDQNRFSQVFQKARNSLKKIVQVQLSEDIKKMIEKHPFAKDYLIGLGQINKELTVKKIEAFDLKRITIQGMLRQLCTPAVYYNITPKSWTNKHNSKEISSYIFHNASDSQLYVARASKPRQFSNEEEIQSKIVAFYLSFLVDPKALTIPQDRNTTLMKFSKIKNYENKKAFLNIRPYLPAVCSLSECLLSKENYLQIFLEGTLLGKRVKGLAGIILNSWIISQSFSLKSFSQQTCFLMNKQKEQLVFADRHSLQFHLESSIHLCRTDFYTIFNSSTYKIIDDTIKIARLSDGDLQIKINQLSLDCLQQMCQLLDNFSEQRMQMISHLFIYHRWQTKLVYLHQIVLFRIKAIKEYLSQLKFEPKPKNSLLIQYPQLACLLVPENYDRFMLPLKNTYFPLSFNYQDSMSDQKQSQNPYLVYMNKACSFAINKIDFPVLSFMQWIKACGRYEVIQYLSMINHSLEDYVIMDKRLKLASVNDKKSTILIVDHAQLCEQLIAKPKTVKTVVIFRLKRPAEMEDLGLISADIDKKSSPEESQDELINILLAWGSRSSEFSSKLQIYDWMLVNYSHIKCHFYGLPTPGNIQFLSTLHKAIATNRHRLKELQQNHKDFWKYIYTFPITKEQQKIVFNYKLFQFIHLKCLFTDILDSKWSGKLQTSQNASVNIWKSIISYDLACRVVNKLIEYLNQLDTKHLDAFQYKYATNDSLQIIKSITQPSLNSANQELPYHLYYEVFTELVEIKNYYKIQHILSSGEYVLVVDEQNIEIRKSGFVDKIQKQQAEILALSILENKLALLIRDPQAKEYYFTQFQITTVPFLSHSKIFTNIIQNEIFKTILAEDSSLLEIYQQQSQLILATYKRNKLIVAKLDLNSQQMQFMQQYILQEIKKLKFQWWQVSIVLLAITNKQIMLLPIQQQLNQEPLVLAQLAFQPNKTLIQSVQDQLHIFVYRLHVIEHYWKTKNEILRKQRFQLCRNIGTIAFCGNILYVFYENCDSLDLFLLQQNKLDKIISYFWVEPNCQQVFVKGQDLFFQGASYLKHIRIRNMETIQKLLLKFN